MYVVSGRSSLGLGPRLHTLEGGVPHWVWDRDYIRIHWREAFLTGSGTETTYTGGRHSSLGLGPRLHTLEGGVPPWVWDRDYIHWREAFLTGSGTETTYTGGRRSSLGLGPRLHIRIHWREAFLTGSGTETTYVYTGGRRSSLGLGLRLHTYTLEGGVPHWVWDRDYIRIHWRRRVWDRDYIHWREAFLTGSGTETTYTGGKRSSLGLGPRLHTLEGSVPHWVWDRDYIHWREAFLTGSGTETGGNREVLHSQRSVMALSYILH